MEFRIEKKIKGKLGRAGIIKTPHGEIKTPAFIPVGTKATVKGLLPEQVKSLGAQAILANTYHLYLQPNTDVIEKAGGLGKFSGWDGPTITDSGGFQVFSLGSAFGKNISKFVQEKDPSKMISERAISDPVIPLAKIGADGVSFKSHLDGSLHYFTPEKSIEIQHSIGADIIFAFDECTSPTEDRRYQEEALERTHRWALRSLEYHKQSGQADNQALFGVIQGGRDEELRRRSAKVIAGMGFDGFGIGGSFDKADLHSAVRWVNEELPEDKPRHLLGIGEPEDLFLGVENGVDMFDCVAPTRNGRNGTLYTHNGKINITNAQFEKDFGPVDEKCGCPACTKFSRAYLRHLYQSNEMLGSILGTMHNLRFILNLVEKMREAILNDTFDEYKGSFLLQYQKE
ncbi:MAG: tRNA guanosine(34) transglycosylase Tgt [Minisyncoccia bacterium]